MLPNISVEDRLALFGGLLSCEGGPRLGLYDGQFVWLDDGDEASKTGDLLLSLCRRGVKLQAFLTKRPEPILFSGRVGLLWILCPALEARELVRIYALGPFLSEPCSSFSLDSALINAGASLTLRTEASLLLRSLPVIPFERAKRYAAMLYYLVSGEQLAPQALRVVRGGTLPSYVHRTIHLDDRQAYAVEQETLRRVSEGDLALCVNPNPVALGEEVLRTRPLGDQLRQMKDDTLSRLTLLSRAAMAGGLSPETGAFLWEKYAQNVETARSGSELISLLQIMQEDFTSRVHTVKHHQMSREIESACNYIEQHLEEPLTIETLAALEGYAAYYFSRKFKRETGMTPMAYIRKKRLQKAAILLLTSGQDVKEIGKSLQFCSHSFFSDCFRQQYGVSPSRYRRNAIP